MKRIFTLLILLLSSHLTFAQSADDLRGAWIMDENDARHIYYFVLRENTVSGVYCFNCSEPTNLAFIDDGSLDSSGFRFKIYHYPDSTSPYTEQVTAELIDHELHLMIEKAGEKTKQVTLHRTRPEDEIVVPMPDDTTNSQVGTGLTNKARVLPGSAENITAEKVLGLWIWGTGPGKQLFMFKQHKGGIRGMVCGPCDSPASMAPLEQISMQGTNFHFEIVHEDNGLDFEIYGPHSNVTEAQVSVHEMLMDVTPSFEAPGFTPIPMTLLGPIAK